MKNNNIRCPYCDWEYLPGEIYIPKYFTGQPKDIVRLANGNIDLYEGIEQNLIEKFTCINCNKNFKIKANINYETSKDNSKEWFKDYTTKIYKNRLTLDEN